MRLPSHTLTPSTSSTDQVLLENRPPIPEITTYLKSTICNFKTLKYDIEGVFYPEETFEILNEDLPDSPIEGVKEIFIHDIIRLGPLFLK